MPLPSALHSSTPSPLPIPFPVLPPLPSPYSPFPPSSLTIPLPFIPLSSAPNPLMQLGGLRERCKLQQSQTGFGAFSLLLSTNKQEVKVI